MKVRELKISGLRGISEVLTIPLHAKGGGPALSTLIFGDNGVGKSSVVDALEFVMRGQVSRRGVGGKKQRRELRNLFSELPPSVIAEMDSGARIARGAVKTPGVQIFKGRSVPSGVGDWPVAVRRQDVEEFWRIDDDRRLEFFYDYFLPVGASVADEQRRAEAIRLHDEAVEAHAIATDRLRPYLSIWQGEIPEHMRAVQAFGSVLVRGNRGLGQEERANLRLYVADFGETLRRRNELAPQAVAARAAQTIDLERVAAVMESLASTVAVDFRAVTGLSWLSRVHFDVAESGRLAVTMYAGDKKTFDPRDLLSEAYLDLLALMIVVDLQIVLAQESDRRFIALDDVFQSVDAPLRQKALQHLASRLNGWQVILTLHDGLWLKAAAKVLEGSQSIRTIRLRSSGHGASPMILDERTGPLSDVDSSLALGASPKMLTQAAGRALEALLHELSFSWSVSVHRPPRDEYKMAYLWDVLYPVFLRSADTDVLATAARINEQKFLRNEAAHPNETAESLSDAEAEQFANDVKLLWSLVTCSACGRLVKSPPSAGSWTPQCSRAHKGSAVAT